MKYENGLVSVVVPTYKRIDTVLRAVSSVLNQTYSFIECIVINDNDPNDEFTSALKDVLSVITDDRLLIVNQPAHKNGAAARNYGIRQAKGEYIAFLDDDDWWKPDKIEKQILQFQQLSDDYAVVTTLVEFYKDGKIIRRNKKYSSDDIMIKILGREVEITTPSILVRHDLLDNVGCFNESLKRHQEIQFLSFLTSCYKLALVPEYLTCVCIEDTQNRPSIEELKKIKSDFFVAVEPLMKELPNKERRCIVELHRLEIAYRKISEKRYISAIKDFLCIMRSPRAVSKSVGRIMKRIKETC